jgi:hypothetical protein
VLLVTKPFPNVFEEPLKDLHTQVLVIDDGVKEQEFDLLVRRARVFLYDALPQLLWSRVHRSLPINRMDGLAWAAVNACS